MKINSILIQDITPEQLVKLLGADLRSQLQDLKKDLINHEANVDLLTRKEACEFLSIDSSTLWSWTNNGKVTAYGIANRRYYKRSHLLECLKPLKKVS
jgi:hypothetical protein